MIPGTKPKADDRKVTRHPLTHDWIDVADVPYQPTDEQKALPIARPSKAVLEWWADVSTMPHCVLWAPGQWRLAKETAVVYGTFLRTRGEKCATELRDRERRLAMTMEGLRDFRIRYVKAVQPAENVADGNVTDFGEERRRRLMAEEADAT